MKTKTFTPDHLVPVGDAEPFFDVQPGGILDARRIHRIAQVNCLPKLQAIAIISTTIPTHDIIKSGVGGLRHETLVVLEVHWIVTPEVLSERFDDTQSVS